MVVVYRALRQRFCTSTASSIVLGHTLYKWTWLRRGRHYVWRCSVVLLLDLICGAFLPCFMRYRDRRTCAHAHHHMVCSTVAPIASLPLIHPAAWI